MSSKWKQNNGKLTSFFFHYHAYDFLFFRQSDGRRSDLEYMMIIVQNIYSHYEMYNTIIEQTPMIPNNVKFDGTQI